MAKAIRRLLRLASLAIGVYSGDESGDDGAQPDVIEDGLGINFPGGGGDSTASLSAADSIAADSSALVRQPRNHVSTEQGGEMFGLESALAGQRVAEHERVHLVGALVGVGALQVHRVTHYAVFPGDAVAAEQRAC